jgi:hypothetical protein
MPKLNLAELRTLLDDRADQYNQPAFLLKDPISIPHRFTRLQDIEISGLFAALLPFSRKRPN